MNSKELFLDTKPFKLFLTAAIPGAVSMLASALYTIFDGIFVGRILGDTAFAAVNLAMPFVIINFSIADLIGVGSAVPISIYLGKRQEKDANNVFTMACIMIVAAGAALGTLMFFAAPQLLAVMGAEKELAALAVDYIRVYAICAPLTTIVFAADNFLRISGKVKMSMWLNIAMSFLTLFFEYIFLAVLKFNIWGAALATCISMVFVAAAALLPFLRGKLQLKFTKPKFTFKEIIRIIKCGMPNFLSNISEMITAVAMNVALLKFGGETAVSVYGILMYAESFIQPVMYGVCDSLQPAIGYNWGAERFDRVKKLAGFCYIVSAVIAVIAAVSMYFFPTEIASIFSKRTDTEFTSMVITAMQLFAFSRLFQWFCFTTQSYMSAIEKSLYSTIISVCMSFVFPMLALVLLYPAGLNGVWLISLVTRIATFAVSALLLIKFRRDMKKKNLI